VARYTRPILRETCATGRRMKSTTKRNPTVTTPAIHPQSAWATRSEIWRSRVARASIRRTKRAKPTSALILAGHGVSLRIHGGALEIRNGLTHYPQHRETYLFFRGDADLPERIILSDCSGSISFDVLSWLSEQKVSLVRSDWRGEIVCVGGASGYSANPFRVQWQLETRENPEQRNEFCRSIVTRKIEATVITLKNQFRARTMGASDEVGAPGYRASKKILPKGFLSCARLRPIVPERIFAAGSACQLNGAA
jgi:hypothetical protein